MDWEIIGFIKASTHRIKILDSLNQKEQTPKELQDSIKIHFSQISLILKELIDKDLVQCLNEDSRKGKIYSITEKGKESIAYIQGGKK